MDLLALPRKQLSTISWDSLASQSTSNARSSSDYDMEDRARRAGACVKPLGVPKRDELARRDAE